MQEASFGVPASRHGSIIDGRSTMIAGLSFGGPVSWHGSFGRPASRHMSLTSTFFKQEAKRFEYINSVYIKLMQEAFTHRYLIMIHDHCESSPHPFPKSIYSSHVLP